MQSVWVQLSEPAYAAIARAAAATGRSAEAIAADQLEIDFSDELPTGFWTTERLASVDDAFAGVDGDRAISMDEARERVAVRREAWRHDPPA